jgi:hypothetical protein
MVIALVSLVALIGLAVVVLQNMNYQEYTIVYGPRRRIAILVGTAVTLLLSAVGMGMGYNSAGQRRNDKQALSWLGFFLGALVLSLTIGVFFLFYVRGEQAFTG